MSPPHEIPSDVEPRDEPRDEERAAVERAAVERGAADRRSEFLQRAAISSLYVAGAAGALGGLELWRGRFQRNRIFAPSRHPAGDWDPGAHGLPCRDVFFKSTDGTRLHGWWIETNAERPVVLFCHGSSGSLGTRLDVLAFLHQLDVNLLAFDYRGYGKSAGTPSEKGVFQDARAACDFAHRELGIEPERLVILGHSLGGGIAIDLALHRPLAGLIVQSSFTDLRGMAVHRHGSSPLPLLARNQFRNRQKLAQLGLPKLFVHGTDDERIPFSMGEELYAAAPPPKAFFAVHGAHHNDLHRHGAAYAHVLRRFVERCCER